MNLSMIQSIIRDIRDDCVGMRRVNPDGRVDGWAARFEGYAAALEGHVPPNPLPEHQQDVTTNNRDQAANPDQDEDVVPEIP